MNKFNPIQRKQTKGVAHFWVTPTLSFISTYLSNILFSFGSVQIKNTIFKTNHKQLYTMIDPTIFKHTHIKGIHLKRI